MHNTLLTFQPGVFCRSLILRRTSPQSSLQKSSMRIKPNLCAMKYLLYWYTILIGEGKEWVQLSVYEIWERAYLILVLKFHVSPATGRWANNIFWRWSATRRNIGRIRCTRFFGSTFENQDIFFRVWGDKGIWLALGSHWEWMSAGRDYNWSKHLYIGNLFVQVDAFMTNIIQRRVALIYPFRTGYVLW